MVRGIVGILCVLIAYFSGRVPAEITEFAASMLQGNGSGATPSVGTGLFLILPSQFCCEMKTTQPFAGKPRAMERRVHQLRYEDGETKLPETAAPFGSNREILNNGGKKMKRFKTRVVSMFPVVMLLLTAMPVTAFSTDDLLQADAGQTEPSVQPEGQEQPEQVEEPAESGQTETTGASENAETPEGDLDPEQPTETQEGDSDPGQPEETPQAEEPEWIKLVYVSFSCLCDSATIASNTQNVQNEFLIICILLDLVGESFPYVFANRL